MGVVGIEQQIKELKKWARKIAEELRLAENEEEIEMICEDLALTFLSFGSLCARLKERETLNWALKVIDSADASSLLEHEFLPEGI